MSAKRALIVDYGMGNIRSVSRAIEQCGGLTLVSRDAKAIATAERLILPGVGAFGDCMAALQRLQLIEPLLAFVASSRPFLGICVGMQVLHDFGSEFAGATGLGLIPGHVDLIPTDSPDGAGRKIPHIGWARLSPAAGYDESRWAGTLFDGLDQERFYYFVHSFSAATINPADTLAVADYQGFPVTAAVQRDNITGTQFHPEKSGEAGLEILRRFLRRT